MRHDRCMYKYLEPDPIKNFWLDMNRWVVHSYCEVISDIKFHVTNMVPTWVQTQVGPILVPWTLLFGWQGWNDDGDDDDDEMVMAMMVMMLAIMMTLDTIYVKSYLKQTALANRLVFEIQVQNIYGA